MSKKNKGRVRSQAELNAIKKYYADKDKMNRGNKQGLISVLIKTHSDKNGGHPHIIMEDIEDKHVSVGLTTQVRKGKNSPNYALENNPLGTDKKSYMRRQGTVDKKSKYKGKRQGVMTPKDYTQAKTYAERAKEKYLREKENKKK